jgi:nitronate monooxygenase
VTTGVVREQREIAMKRPSRRKFLGSAAGLCFSMDVTQATAAQNLRAEFGKFELSAATQRLLSQFGLKYPIFQAPIGSGSNPDLAIAVSSAGAMGGMALWPFPPEEASARVAKVRSATTSGFFVNYALAHEPKSLSAALEAGAPIVQFSWGMPDKTLVAAVRQAGAKMGIQVTSAGSARAAIDLGADYLVCQGTEAGGHVQANSRLLETLPRVLDEAKLTPVIAAGGIGNGADIRAILSAGASGAMIGTRFIATRESAAHPEYKNSLLKADTGDTVLTVCFEGGWPNATHRVLRNGSFTRWDAAGCPPAGKRPGEGDVVATRADGRKILRYAITSPLASFTGNQLLDCALYAGEGVGAVRDIPAAGDLVSRLWKECVAAG